MEGIEHILPQRHTEQVGKLTMTAPNVMKPDSGKDSFFATDKPKKLPPFYFLSLGAVILVVLIFMFFD